MNVQDGEEIYKEFKLMVGSRIEGLSGDLWLKKCLKDNILVSRKRLEELIRRFEIRTILKCPICGGDMRSGGTALEGTRYSCSVASKKWEEEHYKSLSKNFEHLNDSCVTIRRDLTNEQNIVMILREELLGKEVK